LFGPRRGTAVRTCIGVANEREIGLLTLARTRFPNLMIDRLFASTALIGWPHSRRSSSVRARVLGREIVGGSLKWIKATSATASVSYDVDSLHSTGVLCLKFMNRLYQSNVDCIHIYTHTFDSIAKRPSTENPPITRKSHNHHDPFAHLRRSIQCQRLDHLIVNNATIRHNAQIQTHET
jgi:hypothetical protein